ncbi:hypothetical protein [Neorhizobium sp. DAR64860/K0K1]|uniref:hypothetical protein n=1 Tax=Neorhizobium sp. DAR64860/K0K1 TaxID=3421955 RepID=UPI003D284DEE
MLPHHAYAVTSRPWYLLTLALVGAAVLFAVDLASNGFTTALTKETGALEISTALLYAYTAMVWLWTRTGDIWRRDWQVAAIMLLMMGRELDLDKRLTSVGMLKSNLYLTNMAQPVERVFGVLVILFVATVAFRLIVRNGPELLSGVRYRASWAWNIIAAIGLAIVSKSIDGLDRKLAPFGVIVSDHTNLLLGIVEEVLEFGIPVMFLVATISSIDLSAAARGRKPAAASAL